jgi:PE family
VYLITNGMAAATADLEAIGLSVENANLAAVLPTTAIAAPGADEVSLAISGLFSGHAVDYQELAGEAAQFRKQFTMHLVRARQAYTAAEQAAEQALRNVVTAIEQPFVPLLPNGNLLRVAPAVLTNSSIGSTVGGAPAQSKPVLAGVHQLVGRELEQISLNKAALEAGSAQAAGNPATASTDPTPADQATTEYGRIGKWMLESDGEISTWGGQPYGGKTLLEPVNVIIVDPTSTSPQQATVRLNEAMFWSGFPAQPIHSGGFQGTIDGVTYGQRPVLPLLGYSDNFFLLDNDHGRIFGPDPMETSAGYVWTGSFSTEEFAIYDSLPAHAYVSSNTARTALAMRLIMSGQATYGGMVPLDNSYETDSTFTTGDHDGYAVVLVLR